MPQRVKVVGARQDYHPFYARLQDESGAALAVGTFTEIALEILPNAESDTPIYTASLTGGQVTIGSFPRLVQTAQGATVNVDFNVFIEVEPPAPLPIRTLWHRVYYLDADGHRLTVFYGDWDVVA